MMLREDKRMEQFVDRIICSSVELDHPATPDNFTR